MSPSKGSHSQGKYLFRGKLEEYDEQFLICRDIGHHWIPSPHWEVTKGPGGRIIEYRRKSLCLNCDGERTQFYDEEMWSSKSPQYKHARGYLVGVEVEVPMSSRQARLEMVRRHGLDIPAPARRRRRGLRAV